MTNTPQKGYPLQTTGTNVGIWGTVVNNGVLSVLDNNLGGTLQISVAGSSDVNLTAAQAQNLTHDLTGVLTGNIQYIFPAMGGFYTVNNQTTGAFTVTVVVVGGGATVVATQGGATNVTIDAIGLNVLTQSQASTPAAAGTLTGTTLASNVVNSSLTGVGTIATGVWNGTTIAVANGGTGAVTLPANNLIVGNGTSAPNFIAPGASGNVLTSNGTNWLSSASGAGTGASFYHVSDSTDIVLNNTPTQTNIGTTISATIPLIGWIRLTFEGEIIGAVTPGYLNLGIRIGSTNYWASFNDGGTEYLSALSIKNGTVISHVEGFQVSQGQFVGGPLGLSIVGNSIPTGVQTIQPIVGYTTNGGTIKGTVVTSYFYISVTGY